MKTHVIRAHPLFENLNEADFQAALAFFSARRKGFKRGEFLNRVGAPLERFGLLLSGAVQVYMDDINGCHMIMANVGPGDTFGESLCYLGLDAPVYICAMTECEALFLSVERLRASQPETALERLLAARFTAMLARRTLSMNDRVQILSKNSLRGKLTAFFSQYVNQYGSSFTIPFDRGNMAVYLGADRSALSRELGRMRDEGIIRFEKNRFEILRQFE